MTNLEALQHYEAKRVESDKKNVDELTAEKSIPISKLAA